MIGLTIKNRGVSGLVRAYFRYFFSLPIALPILGLVTVRTTSCVQKSDHKSDASSVLRLWKASHGETRQDFEHVVAPFLELNPDLRIEVLAHPWEGWDERYAIAYTGRIPPDIAYMPDEFWPRFAAAGKLLALEQYFPQEIEVMAQQYPDNLWQLGSMDSHQYGRHIVEPASSDCHLSLPSEILHTWIDRWRSERMKNGQLNNNAR